MSVGADVRVCSCVPVCLRACVSACVCAFVYFVYILCQMSVCFWSFVFCRCLLSFVSCPLSFVFSHLTFSSFLYFVILSLSPPLLLDSSLLGVIFAYSGIWVTVLIVSCVNKRLDRRVP